MTSFRNINQPTGRIIHLDHNSYLFFGGTAYLGLLQNPDYMELYKDGMDKYGLNNGTSRSNNVQLGIYEEAEADLAKRFGFETSALFSSGYLAAQAGIRSLTQGKQIFYAPDCHPSLWLNGNPQVNGTFEEWLDQTIADINNSGQSEFVLVSNCMDNLTPRLYDFAALQKIDQSKRVLLILDDSHGLAIVHKNAVSTDLKALEAPNIDVVVLASLAKGLGADAGILMGSVENVDLVKKDPIFLGASPCAPATLYALKNGGAIYSFAFDQMQRNAQQLAQRIQSLPLGHIPNFPVFSSNDPGLYERLLNNKIVISSFPYPLPDSPLLNRIVISALHRPADIDWLAEILSR